MSETDLDPMYASLERTTAFVWRHLLSIVGISLAWFLAAIPIVTIGPATVGAYAAVLSMHENDISGRIDVSAVLSTVRAQFVHATLLGLIPLVLLVIAANYTLAYLASGTVAAGVLALGCLYLGLYASVVSIPTFLRLAEGDSPTVALRSGYLWTARNSLGGVALWIVTIVLFAVTSVLTVGVALLFAGIACTLHIEFVTAASEKSHSRTDPLETGERTLTSGKSRQTEIQQ